MTIATKVESDLRNNYISLKIKDRVMLAIYRRLNLKCPMCMWKKREKILKLADTGKQMINREFDMLKIIKNLRDLRILMKH